MGGPQSSIKKNIMNFWVPPFMETPKSKLFHTPYHSYIYHMMLSGRFHCRHVPLLVVRTRGHQTHETLQFGHEHVALALPLTFISSFATVLNTCAKKCYRTAAQRPGLSVSAMLPAGPLG